jgi:hypothetical protein
MTPEQMLAALTANPALLAALGGLLANQNGGQSPLTCYCFPLAKKAL